MNDEHSTLARIDLDETARAEAMQCVDQVFALFTAWNLELLRYALQHRSPERNPQT